MPKIIDYAICAVGHHTDLRGNVMANIQEGWTMYGSPYHSGIHHCQAMVKYAPQPSLKDGKLPTVEEVTGIYQKNDRDLLAEACVMLFGKGSGGYDQTDMMSIELYAWWDAHNERQDPR